MKPVFDQFYQLPSFRKEVLSVPDDFFQDKDLKDNILYQLREAFKAKDSLTKPLNIGKLAISMKKKFTDLVDAQEFIFKFYNQLDKQIKGTKYENLFKNSIVGSFNYELVNMDCPHSSSKQEEFANLVIDVKNKKNLIEGLEQFTQGAMIEGYSCPTCHKIGTVMKRALLQNLPNHLFFFLKRLEFDFETYQLKLIEDYFELPSTLNMAPFTTQGLTKDKANEEESKESKPPSLCFEYKLSGVVVFKGDIHSGNYYSLAQERESGTWYEIMNTTIEKFDPKNLPEETFGGVDSNGLPKQNKSYAYVAIYDKIKEDLGSVGITETSQVKV